MRAHEHAGKGYRAAEHPARVTRDAGEDRGDHPGSVGGTALTGKRGVGKRTYRVGPAAASTGCSDGR
ncbi:hypothetical protein GCM10009827_071560 [Dactylosporangium maewongense]|uniref:Uncharacterized protein n=1 Tax=Dactylosporangium maewongense TaxID=634393 RepID=A0ABN2BKK3_9ACTN